MSNNPHFKEPEIEIELHNFFNQSESLHKQHFIGRKKELEKLVDLLKRNHGGSYLVSGYRGVGKTRFVEQALVEYGKKIGEEKVIEVRVNLGSDNKINSRTVLTNIVTLFAEALEEEVKDCNFYKLNKFFQGKAGLFLIILFSSIAVFLTGALFGLVSIDENLIQKLFKSDIKTNFIDSLIFISVVISIISFLCIIFSIVLRLLKFENLFEPRDLIPDFKEKLEALQKEIYLTAENNASIGNSYIGNKGKKEVVRPLDNNQIESRLKKILRSIKKEGKNKLQVIFIFDELDKLSGRNSEKIENDIDLIKESKLRKIQIDSILGDLKSLITDTSATYIFIAGRDMYDAYLSERGSTNSLYESLFHDHIYIPSLLTDRSNDQVYLLDSMIEAFVVSNVHESIKGPDLNGKLSDLTLKAYFNSWDTHGFQKQNKIETYHYLKILIHFLALHSWGNYKRLITLFETFVIKKGSSYFLNLKIIDIQRLILASHLYIMFHHNLSRMLMNADDKLVVSSFSVYLHIMKYHGIGFTKENVLRMYETINVHSSPELTRVVDIILKNVLTNHIRIIRNGIHHFRFSYLHEKEIHFITNINDDESAAFNFSLNAMDAVKQHYRNLIADSRYTHADDKYGHIALASIHIIVGNFHFWEQSYDEANIQYGMAADILERNYILQQQNEEYLGKDSLILQLIEVYLRQGSVAERLGNYAKAESIYKDAEQKAGEYLKNFRNEDEDVDSKWGILLQPKWAKHYLQLKRDSFNYAIDQSSATNTTKYKEGMLLLYSGKFTEAFSRFMQICCAVSPKDQASYFLLGNAYFRAAFSLFLNFSASLQKKLIPEERCEKQWDLALGAIVKAVDGIQEINQLYKKNNKLESFEKDIVHEFRGKYPDFPEDEKKAIQLAFGLLRLSAIYFIKGRLNLHAAISSLSIVMMWNALIEMLLWQKVSKNYNNKLRLQDILFIVDLIRKDSGIVPDSQEQAFTAISINTGNAFSHFMKTGLYRDLGHPLSGSLYEKHDRVTNLILDSEYLKDHGLHQQYSIFGQVVVASIYWERIAIDRLKDVKGDSKQFGELEKGYLLPYGIRYYATMLWLRGRILLGKVLNDKYSDWKDLELLSASVDALILFFRASQYVIKTHGETAAMGFPPLYIIYYNMWEILARLLLLHKNNPPADNPYRYRHAALVLREKLDEVLLSKKVKDVSTRIFDIAHIERIVKEQFKIIEQIGIQNSSDRLSIMRNKYYLEDDYEDNMFNLDWFYCRFFAPGAVIYRTIVKNEMKELNPENDEI